MSFRYVYGTVVTGIATAANNRGDNNNNGTTLQKVFVNGEEHTSVSAEAIRYALRRSMFLSGVPVNRKYADDSDAYEMTDPQFDDWRRHADDVLMGFMVAKAKAAKAKDAKDAKEKDDDEEDRINSSSTKKRRGQLSVGRAISLFPFLQEGSFNCKAGEKKKAKDGGLSLYEAEAHTTPYQYTFGVNVSGVPDVKMVDHLLTAVCDIGPVGGNHARFLYDFSPESIILRVTSAHSPRIQNCFEAPEPNNNYTLERLIGQIEAKDVAGEEIIVGGLISKNGVGERMKQLGVSVLPGVRAAATEAMARLQTAK